MKHLETEHPQALTLSQHDLMQWLKKNISLGNTAEMFTLLARTLPLAKPGTLMQRDIVENMLEIVTDAGHVAPVPTLEALCKSVLWAGFDYIPHFARAIMLLEHPALELSPNRALAALEESLMVCYSVILPRNIHGVGRCNDQCLAWQRYTFSSILQTVENNRPLLDPALVKRILQLSEIMTSLTPQMRDLHEKIKFITHTEKSVHSHWH